MFIKFIYSFLKYCAFVIASCIIAVAVFIAVFRLYVNQNPHFLEALIAKKIHHPVYIEKTTSTWYQFSPAVVLKAASIKNHSGNQELFHFNHIVITIDVLKSIKHWSLVPRKIVVIGGKATLKDSDQQACHQPFCMMKMASSHNQSTNRLHGLNDKSNNNIFNSLLVGPDIIFKNIQLKYHTKGLVIPFSNIHGRISQNKKSHVIIVKGYVSDNNTVPFLLQISGIGLFQHIKKSESKLYFKISHFPLAYLSQVTAIKSWLQSSLSFNHLSIKRGQANVSLWTHWEKGHFQSIQSVFNIENLQASTILTDEKEQQVHHISLDHLKTNICWEKEKNGWSLTADQFDMSLNHQYWPERQFGVSIKQVDNTRDFSLTISNLSAVEFKQSKYLLTPWIMKSQRFSDLFSRFAWYGGQLIDVNILYSSGKGLTPYYHLLTKGQHLNLKWQPRSTKKEPEKKAKAPIIAENISGQIEVTPSDGHVKLLSSNTLIDASDWFQDSFQWNHLNASIQWDCKKTGLKFDVDNLFLSDGNFSWKGNAHLFLPQYQLSTAKIDLQGILSVRELSLLSNYIPKFHDDHSLKFKNWINHAFSTGSLTDSLLRLKGSIDQFPYKQGGGLFEFKGSLDHVTLNYDKEWPPLSNISGVLYAKNNAIKINVDSGTIIKNPIENVSAEILDLTHPKLSIVGHVNSTLDQGLEFLKVSPLSIKSRFEYLSLHGPMKLDLHLDIPLYLHHKMHHQIKSSGVIMTNQGQVHFNQFPGMEINHMTGTVNFVNNKISAQSVKGDLGPGLPLTINAKTVSSPDGHSNILLSLGGLIDVNFLKKTLGLPALTFIDGSTHYRALFKLNDDTMQGSEKKSEEFHLKTDLVGLASTLPAPFQKNKSESTVFSMNLYLNRAKTIMALDGYYNKKAAFSFLFKNKNKQFVFSSGHIHLGASEPIKLPKASSFHITGDMKSLDLYPWYTFFKTQSVHHQKERLSLKPTHSLFAFDFPNYLDFKVGQLHVKKWRIDDLQVNAAALPSGWQLKVQSPQIAGVLNIDHKHQWHVNLDHLVVPQWPKNKTSLVKQEKQKLGNQQALQLLSRLPGMQINVNKLKYGKKLIGQLHMSTSQLKHGVKINELKIHHPFSSLFVKGGWEYQDKAWETKLSGRLDSAKLGDGLSYLNITNTLTGGNGSVIFDLQGPGIFYSKGLSDLKGNVEINFENGHLQKLGGKIENQLNVGRFFSLFDIPKLPFNLVTLGEKGLPFSQFKGHFSLSDGVASTSDFVINGDMMWVNMKGFIGYVKKDYNLNVRVVPNITSTVPLIAGLTGGPIVGAAVWLLDKILASKVGTIAQSDYHIGGSWDKPEVTKGQRLAKNIYEKSRPSKKKLSESTF